MRLSNAPLIVPASQSVQRELFNRILFVEIGHSSTSQWPPLTGRISRDGVSGFPDKYAVGMEPERWCGEMCRFFYDRPKKSAVSVHHSG